MMQAAIFFSEQKANGFRAHILTTKLTKILTSQPSKTKALPLVNILWSQIFNNHFYFNNGKWK